MQLGDVRPQHLHVIAQLGQCADGGARGSDRVPLLDGDGGQNAFDAIHLRFVHAIEKLAGVRRKRLDVPALPFSKERVESKRTLARTAQARNHNQSLERQVEVEILQVILPDAAKANDRAGRRL